MKSSETIDRLQKIRQFYQDVIKDDTAVEAVDMAIKAVEKQEKKPAKAKFNRRYNKFVYFCPVCGEVTGNYDFCSECGQAIDYDNTEPYEAEEGNE